jgi:hypothetical protein
MPTLPAMKHSNEPVSVNVTPTGAAATYTIEVRSDTTTRHHVTAPPAYLQELGVAAYPPEHVIHEAFQFLLEREPNTSILATFELRVIERYFPEFRAEIAPRMSRTSP